MFFYFILFNDIIHSCLVFIVLNYNNNKKINCSAMVQKD